MQIVWERILHHNSTRVDQHNSNAQELRYFSDSETIEVHGRCCLPVWQEEVLWLLFGLVFALPGSCGSVTSPVITAVSDWHRSRDDEVAAALVHGRWRSRGCARRGVEQWGSPDKAVLIRRGSLCKAVKVDWRV